MVKCTICKKEVDYTFVGLCFDCANQTEELNTSVLKEILEELKSIKNVLGYLK